MKMLYILLYINYLIIQFRVTIIKKIKKSYKKSKKYINRIDLIQIYIYIIKVLLLILKYIIAKFLIRKSFYLIDIKIIAIIIYKNLFLLYKLYLYLIYISYI